MKSNQSLFLLLFLSVLVLSCGLNERTKEAAALKRNADSLIKGLEKVSKELDSISKEIKGASDSMLKSIDSIPTSTPGAD